MCGSGLSGVGALLIESETAKVDELKTGNVKLMAAPKRSKTYFLVAPS